MGPKPALGFAIRPAAPGPGLRVGDPAEGGGAAGIVPLARLAGAARLSERHGWRGPV